MTQTQGFSFKCFQKQRSFPAFVLMSWVRLISRRRERAQDDEPAKKDDPARESKAGSPLLKTDPSRLKAHTSQPTTRTFTPPARTHPASTPGDRSLPPSWRPASRSKIQSGRMYQVQIAKIKNSPRMCARSQSGWQIAALAPSAVATPFRRARPSYSGVASPSSDMGCSRLFGTNCTWHGARAAHSHSPLKKMYLMEDAGKSLQILD